MVARLSRLGLVLACGIAMAGCVSSHDVQTPADEAGWQGRSPNTADTFRFVILSDRTGGHVPGDYEKAIAEVNLLKPDFVICVGDLIEGYQSDPAIVRTQWLEVEQMIARLDAPFYYVPGNHDVKLQKPGAPATGLTTYTARHGVRGKSYYSFDYRECHFLILNSPTAADDQAFCDEQLEFIRHDLAHAKGARHTFVFTHYPLWADKKTWPTLSQLLPKGQSTIFNGHTHSLQYNLTDGIPSYVLPSTGAATDDAPGDEHLYAQVVVSGGRPTIALVPPGQIKPAGYAHAIDDLREILSSQSVPAVNAEGGSVVAAPVNKSADSVAITYQWLAADWEITPATARTTLAPGATASVKFVMKPAVASPTTPTLIRTCVSSGGFGASSQQRIPVSFAGTLGMLPAVVVDGNDAEWAAIPAMELSSSSLIVAGKDKWHGPADSSGSARAAIAGDRLAMFIQVKDDQICTDQKDFWTNDAVEVCWDGRPAGARNGQMQRGTGQLGIVPSDGSGPAKIVGWVPAGQAAAKVPAGLQTFTRRTTGGYVIELSIPLADLAVDAVTLQRDGLGLAITLDDRDISGAEAVQKRLSITGRDDFWRNTAGYARFLPAK